MAGHLLFLTGHVAAVELERHAELANSIGKASFKFAFIMDRAKSERERGITIDSYATDCHGSCTAALL